MLELFLAMILAWANPAHSNSATIHNHSGHTVVADGTGGETGPIPPNPPGQ